MRHPRANMNNNLRSPVLAALGLGLALVTASAVSDEEIILLPNDDGTVGKIYVLSGSDGVEVDEERARVTLYAKFLAPVLDEVSQAQVQNVYGSVLGIAVPPDNPLDTLPEIVNLTLATHPAYMNRVHERQAMDFYTFESMRNFQPRINAFGEIGTEWTRDPGTRALGDDSYLNLTRREITVEVRQMLFDGWASFSEYDRRQADADSVAYQLQALGERLASQVADVYLNLLRDNELLELANKNLERHQELLERIRERGESGVGRDADVEQAIARVSGAQTAVVERETALFESMIRYVDLVGYPPTTVLIKPEPTKDGLPPSVDAAVDYAVQHHPAIITSEADIEAVNQQIRNARSLNWPRLELVVAKRYGDDLDGTKGFDEDFQVLLNLNYNLYNGEADQAKIRRSLARKQQAMDAREDNVREVSEAVRQAWNGFTQIERRIASLERHVESQVKAHDAYVEQFRVGDRTLLDVLDAENELFQARSNLVEARRDYGTALYRLRASMGTLVEHFAADIPREAVPTIKYGRTP